ncbi:MAG: ATP-binding protein, partial [Solirubrobacterales bacterium]
APLVPELGARLPRDARAGRRQETDRYRLFEAADAMLDAASSLTPTLLVLDDLHWADRDTLLLLRHLIRSPSRSPLFIIGTYRASEPGEDLLESLAHLGRDRLYDRISLDGFDQHETASMVSLLVGRDLPEEFARSLGEDMGGNPFAIHAMVRHLLESGQLGADGQSLPSAPSLYAAGLPEDLEELLRQRISRLDGGTRRVLSAAAVIGSEFDADLVGSVAELDSVETIEAIEQAGLAGLVASDAAKPGDYRFAHALVRQSLYAALPSRLRSRLHQNAAESLVGTPEAARRPSEVARHYMAAGGDQVAEAAAYSITAAELAEEVHAYLSAVGHYRSALDALEAVGGDAATDVSRRELLRALGNAQRRAGEVESARRSFLQLARAGRTSGDSEALAQAALGFGGPSSAG